MERIFDSALSGSSVLGVQGAENGNQIFNEAPEFLVNVWRDLPEQRAGVRFLPVLSKQKEFGVVCVVGGDEDQDYEVVEALSGKLEVSPAQMFHFLRPSDSPPSRSVAFLGDEMLNTSQFGLYKIEDICVGERIMLAGGYDGNPDLPMMVTVDAEDGFPLSIERIAARGTVVWSAAQPGSRGGNIVSIVNVAKLEGDDQEVPADNKVFIKRPGDQFRLVEIGGTFVSPQKVFSAGGLLYLCGVCDSTEAVYLLEERFGGWYADLVFTCEPDERFGFAFQARSGKTYGVFLRGEQYQVRTLI